MDLKVYNEFIDYLLKHEYPLNYTPQEKQKLARQAIQYVVENGILFKRNKKTPEHPLRVITLQDREKILYNLHSSPLAGHFGLRKTIEKAAENYYWPGMGNDIKAYIESCDSCQRFGKPRKVQFNESIQVIQPFYQIGIDYIGPLNITSSENKYILVAVDYFTKWPKAKVVKEATAKETAKFLYETIICQHGVPSIILSDRGTHFVNETVKLLKEEVGFKHRLTSAYHPQTNGLTERFNGTLCRALAKTLQTSDSEWDQLIPSVLFAYRTLKQESTKQTPFYLVHGREAQLPVDFEFQEKEQDILPINNFEESLNRRISALKGIFTDALIINHKRIQHAQELQKKRQQNLKKALTYNIEDIVLIYDSAKQHVYGDKFSIKWNGPFWIHSKVGNNTYIVRDKIGNVIQKPIHAERLKHYKLRYLVEPHVVITP